LKLIVCAQAPVVEPPENREAEQMEPTEERDAQGGVIAAAGHVYLHWFDKAFMKRGPAQWPRRSWCGMPTTVRTSAKAKGQCV